MSSANRRTTSERTSTRDEMTWEELREEVTQALHTRTFDLVIGIVIFLNAVSIGVEQSLEIKGIDTTTIQVIESVFLVIYIFELSLRVFADGFSCFKDNWVKFDAILVILGITNSWIVEPFFDEAPEAMGPLMLLRTARLLRLGKTARLFARIQTFWMLIRGLLNSVGIMCYTFLILFLVMYLFSSLALELIAKNKLNIGLEPDAKFQEIASTYFSSLPQAMLTMLQFMCLDEVSDIYRPLVERDSILAIYFVFVIMVVNLLLLNLISAVIMSSTIEQNANEQDSMKKAQEEEWATLLGDLKEIFVRLDEDNSGYLSRAEIVCMDEKDQARLCSALGVTTPLEVFGILDFEGHGQVSLNEFFDRIVDLVLSKGDVDLKRMERQIETMHWRLKETFSSQLETQNLIRVLLNQLTGLTIGAGDLAPDNVDKVSEHESKRLDIENLSQELVSSFSRQVPPGEWSATGKQDGSRAKPEAGDEDLPPWAQEMTDNMRKILDDSTRRCAQQVRLTLARGQRPAMPSRGSKTQESIAVSEPADSGPKKAEGVNTPKAPRSGTNTPVSKRSLGPPKAKGAARTRTGGQGPVGSSSAQASSPATKEAKQQQQSSPLNSTRASTGPSSAQSEDGKSGKLPDSARRTEALPDDYSLAEVPAPPPPATSDAVFWIPQGAS